MRQLNLPKRQLIEIDGHLLTDHNRSELEITPERIEKAARMWNGTMRKFVIADKRTFSFSYDNLPKTTQWVVDGKWTGKDIRDFYNNNPGAFQLKINHGDGEVETYMVMFQNFSMSIVKRGRYDMWQVNCELVEV